MTKQQKPAGQRKGKTRKLRKQRKSRIGEIIIERLRDYLEALERGENIAKKYKCYVVTADGKRKRLRKFP